MKHPCEFIPCDVNPTKEPVVNPTLEPDVNPTKEPDVNPTKEPDPKNQISFLERFRKVMQGSVTLWFHFPDT